MKSLMALFFILFPLVAVAGPRVGNGGDVIVCHHADTADTVELLDHYEARTVRDIKVNLGNARESVDTKLNRIFERLGKIDRTRALLYQGWYQSFYADAGFTDGNIVQIPDIGALSFPKNCEIVQIAVHQDPDLPGDRRYIIRQDLWNLMDNDSRAGLILHELIYRDLITQEVAPHTSSKFARYFNAYLSSDAFLKLNLKAYYDLLVKLNFASMDAQYGFPILLFKETAQGPMPTKVDFSGEIIIFAEKAALMRVPLSYNWHGVALPVVEGLCTLQARIFSYDGTPKCVDTSLSRIVFDCGWVKGSEAWDYYPPSLNIPNDEILTVARYCDDERYQNGNFPELSFEGQLNDRSVNGVAQGVFIGFYEQIMVQTRRETSLCVDPKFKRSPF